MRKDRVRMAGIILVVDDDEDIRETLRLVLELEDYQVLVASNGREALEVMRTNRPLSVSSWMVRAPT